MIVSAHELVQTRVCVTAGCVDDVADMELGLCAVCARRRRVVESEITLEVFRDRGRCWIRALHLPSRARTGWRELEVWNERVRRELVDELRGLVQGSA